ncbi:hypothetical protein C8J23_1275 [Shewanella chilikensis]|uniref:Uncharacterized protein n=1 Tax=Shewanella chilikensis TaxID=558541 RepID=A0ABX5PKE9_9GAMM|nr:hypothetical protein C8J23_1275 [Shewanella chilikensis]
MYVPLLPVLAGIYLICFQDILRKLGNLFWLQ